MPPPQVWASQPFKAAYISYFLLLKAPIQLAILALLYAIKGRPLPARSFGQNIAATLTRMVFDLCATARLPHLAYDDPLTAGERCVVVQPADERVYHGALSSSPVVKPQAKPAVWFPGPPPSTPEDTALLKTKQNVVLQFVGGAFVMGLGYKHYGDDVFKLYSQHLKADRVIWADYRICDGSPEMKFPAPIQDAVTHYAYLISLGIDPKNIVLAGDSAGGNMVLALLRHLQYLHEEQPESALPLPGGAIVFSPWVTVTPTVGQDFYKYENSRYDTVSSALGQWGADAYRPQGKLSDEIEGFVSPFGHPFKTSVPLYIHDGDAEVLHEDIKLFASQMLEKNGEKNVRYHSTPVAPHDLLLAHPVYKLTAQLGKAIDEAYQFFEASK